MQACAMCGEEVPDPSSGVCPTCGARLGAPSGPSLPENRSTGVCPNCRTPMSAVGELAFRVGGSTGAKGMLLGGWNQLSESTQPFSVYHCPTCGRVDLYEAGR